MMSDAMKPLAGTHFAVFGLGNTSYELYNKSGKVLDRQLEQCGGTREMEIGLGDDDGDIEVAPCCLYCDTPTVLLSFLQWYACMTTTSNTVQSFPGSTRWRKYIQDG